MIENKKYAILAVDKVGKVDFTETLHRDASRLRLNKKATKCIVSYKGRQPLSLSGEKEYSWVEINALMQDDTNEWYIPSSDLENGSWTDSIKDSLRRYLPFEKWFRK